jgi:hypothetical protein
MYHPSVYDNLKVVFEGVIYDSDFSGAIEIIDRKDLVDFAIFEKSTSIAFKLSGIDHSIIGKMILTTNLEKIAIEKLKDNPDAAGCNLSVEIKTPVYEIETDCKKIQMILRKWTAGVFKGEIKQKLTYIYGESRNVFHNTISIQIENVVTEEDSEHFNSVLDQLLRSMHEINDYFKGYIK